MAHNIGIILVLFILLVIVACSCGVFGRNERNDDRHEEKNNERGSENRNDRGYGGGCGAGY